MVEKLYVYGRWVNAKRKYQLQKMQDQQSKRGSVLGEEVERRGGFITEYSNNLITQSQPVRSDQRPIRPMKMKPFDQHYQQQQQQSQQQQQQQDQLQNLQKTPSPQKQLPSMHHKKPHAQMTPLPNIQSNRSRGNSSGGDDIFTDRSLGNGPELDMSRYDTAQKRSMITSKGQHQYQQLNQFHPITAQQNYFNRDFRVDEILQAEGATSYGNDNLMIGTLKKKNDIGALDEFLSQQELDRIKKQGQEKRKKIQQRKKNAKQNRKQVYDPKKALQEEVEKKKSNNSKPNSKLKSKIQESKERSAKKIKEAKSLLQQAKDENQLGEYKQKQNTETNTQPSPETRKQGIVKSASNKHISPSSKNKDQYENQASGQQANDEQAQQQQNNGTSNRPFLRRKSQAVKFQKLNWNKVKKRIDCWNAGNNTGIGFNVEANTSVVEPIQQINNKPVKEKKFLTQGGGQQASSIRSKNTSRLNRKINQELADADRRKSNIPVPTSSIRQHNNPNQRRNQQGGSAIGKSKNNTHSVKSTGPSSKERGKQRGSKLSTGQVAQESRIPRPSYIGDKIRQQLIFQEDQNYNELQEQIKTKIGQKSQNNQFQEDSDDVPNEYYQDSKSSQRNINLAMVTMGQVKGSSDYHMESLLQKSDLWQDQLGNYNNAFGTIEDLEYFYNQLHGGQLYQDGDMPETSEIVRIPMIAKNSFFMKKYTENIYDDLKAEYEQLVGDYNQQQEQQQE